MRRKESGETFPGALVEYYNEVLEVRSQVRGLQLDAMSQHYDGTHEYAEGDLISYREHHVKWKRSVETLRAQLHSLTQRKDSILALLESQTGASSETDTLEAETEQATWEEFSSKEIVATLPPTFSKYIFGERGSYTPREQQLLLAYFLLGKYSRVDTSRSKSDLDVYSIDSSTRESAWDNIEIVHSGLRNEITTIPLLDINDRFIPGNPVRYFNGIIERYPFALGNNPEND